jgi:hypothetical protein
MHHHIEWSSSGFDTERFETFGEAFDAAQATVQRAQPEMVNGLATPVRPDETFEIEVFDNVCPVCLRSANSQRA